MNKSDREVQDAIEDAALEIACLEAGICLAAVVVLATAGLLWWWFA